MPEPLLAVVRAKPPDADGWTRILAIYVGSASDASAPPVMGTHAVDGQLLVFTPRFPLRPGLAYRAVFDLAALPGDVLQGDKIEAIVTPPAPAPGPRAKVAAVYPSGDELPENLLKFYVHFTAPMARGDAYRYLHIIDADGREVPDAFLRLGEELWSRDGRRFTLLFDPGRIKRGLVPNLEEGAPLRADRSYTLVIDADWRDATGGPLAAEFRKEFRTMEPDETQPDPKRWTIKPPTAGTLEPLSIDFDEPLDQALAMRMIAVRDHADREVEGRIRLLKHETRWEFRPNDSWRPGRYTLVVAGTLEDRAGNSIGRPFEVANAGDEVGVTSADRVVLLFEIPGL